MINHINDKLELRQLTDLDDFCALIYGKEDSVRLEEGERLDCGHLFNVLLDERVIFYTCTTSNLFEGIGIQPVKISLRQERNLFTPAFLVRSALNGKGVKIEYTQGLLFVAVVAEGGNFMVSRTQVNYDEYPQLNAWVRKISIDKILLTL